MIDRAFADMLRTADMQARIASHLYSGRETVTRFAAEQAADSIYFRAQHVRAVALLFDTHTHISVCGTNDIHDWMDNFSARQRSCEGLLAHSGFVSAANSLLSLFAVKGLKARVEERPLVIGGHSAGGAIAELLSCVRWLQPREVVTLGSPRVFSSDSAAYYAAKPWKHYRFVSGGDPVPGLPLRKFRCLFGRATYAHTSSPIEVDSDGSVMIGSEITLGRSIARHAASLALWAATAGKMDLSKIPSLRAKHDVGRYADRVSAAVSKYGA